MEIHKEHIVVLIFILMGILIFFFPQYMSIGIMIIIPIIFILAAIAIILLIIKTPKQEIIDNLKSQPKPELILLILIIISAICETLFSDNLKITIILAIILMIVEGYYWLTQGGEEEK